MPAVFVYQLTVPDSAIDGQGHVNNVEYIRWMQDAAVAHSAAQGWPPQRYQDCGAGWVARYHQIEYLLPAFAGEHVLVYTWVSNFRKIRSLRKYKIVRATDRAVLAVAETDWAFIGLEHHVPRRLPPELIESFSVVPEAEEPQDL
jgi:acyl-CoA thioester hydrolase